MITTHNTYGRISMTSGYFAELVSAAAQSGFGVAGMANTGQGSSLKDLVLKGTPEKGVRVSEVDGELLIQLHIKVSYGLNIAAAVKSIIHKVKYVVEEATGLAVRGIKVSVDDVVP